MTAARRKKKGRRGAGSEEEEGRQQDNGQPPQWEAEPLFQEESTSVESVDIVETLERQVEAARNQLIRITSEFANFRKRSRDEKEKTLMYASEALVMDLLPVFDDFERALDHMNGDPEDLSETLEGVRLIWRRLIRILEQRGVKRFESLGERFDPFRHEAMQIQDVEGMPPGTVVQEVEKGYAYHERLLRAARVIVTPLAGKAKDEESEHEETVAEESEMRESVVEEPVEEETGAEEVDAEESGTEDHVSDEEEWEIAAESERVVEDKFEEEETAPAEEPLSGDEWLLDESALDGGEGGEDEEFVEEKTRPEVDGIE